MSVNFIDSVVQYLVPIEQVQQHPENPNTGDVDVIAESILSHGFYNPVLVQASTGFILAGNHRYAALLSLGETQIPAIYIDCDNEKALRILIVDNRTAEMAVRNNRDVEHLLMVLDKTDEGLLGTGYTDEALLELRSLNRALDHIGFGNPQAGNAFDTDVRPQVVIYGLLDENGAVDKFIDSGDVEEAVVRLRDLGYHAIGRNGDE